MIVTFKLHYFQFGIALDLKIRTTFYEDTRFWSHNITFSHLYALSLLYINNKNIAFTNLNTMLYVFVQDEKFCKHIPVDGLLQPHHNKLKYGPDV